MFDLLAIPERGQDRERLVQAGGANLGVRRFAEGNELDLDSSPAVKTARPPLSRSSEATA